MAEQISCRSQGKSVIGATLISNGELGLVGSNSPTYSTSTRSIDPSTPGNVTLSETDAESFAETPVTVVSHKQCVLRLTLLDSTWQQFELLGTENSLGVHVRDELA